MEVESKFRVTFQGELLPGENISQVKQKIAALYKVSMKQIEPWFSGKRVTIKDDIDYTTATKYKEALERMGAQCVIEQLELNASQSVSPSKPASAKESTHKTMICPQCGGEQPHTDTCIYCGIIIAKYLEKKKQEFLERKQSKRLHDVTVEKAMRYVPERSNVTSSSQMPSIPKPPINVSIARNGSLLGTYQIDHINQYLGEGRLTLQDQAWYEGIALWIPLAFVPGIAGGNQMTFSPPSLPNAFDSTAQRSSRSKEYEGIYCSKDDKMVFGLCGGLAHKYNVPVSVVRLLVFVALWWIYPIALFLPKLPTKNV